MVTTLIFPLSCLTDANSTCAEVDQSTCTAVASRCVSIGADITPGPGIITVGCTADASAGTFTLGNGSTVTYCRHHDTVISHTISAEGAESIGVPTNQP